VKQYQTIVIPEVVSISGDAIVVYRDYSNAPKGAKRTELQVKAAENLKEKSPSGVVTPRIKKQMTTILNNWLQCLRHSPRQKNGHAEYLPTFVTLTLPAKQFHTDKHLNVFALNRFIQWAKRKADIKHYLWRAERQENGNIHYHIIFDRYIQWDALRAYWNDIMNDLGYIDAYRKEQEKQHEYGFTPRLELVEKWGIDAQKAAYEKGTAEGWSDPNSTDIHKLGRIKDVAAYVTKYMSKEDTIPALKALDSQLSRNEISPDEYEYQKARFTEILHSKKINARLWGCSDSLRDLKNPSFCVDSGAEDFLTEAAAQPDARVIIHDHVKLIFTKELPTLIRKNKYLRGVFEIHSLNNYRHLYDNAKLPDEYEKFVPESEIEIKPFTPVQLSWDF
jgi:hypothetical protein